MTLPYGQSFYARQAAGSERSARQVLRVLFGFYRPASMVDFGCGVGTWLKAGHELGVGALEGYEGPWVSKEQLLLSHIRFFNANVAEPIQTDRFDLALCIESGGAHSGGLFQDAHRESLSRVGRRAL